MASKKKNHRPSPVLQERLSQLEALAVQQGVQIHYDVLEAAGLKLKGGVCTVRGEQHLYVDRRKSLSERIDFLKDYLQDLPSLEPTVQEETPQP